MFFKNLLRLNIAVALLCLFIFAPQTVQAKLNSSLPEAITSFESNIDINQNTSLTIKEKIIFETTLDKHGIYRYLPVTYNHDGLKKRLPITNISVADQDDVKIPFEKSFDGKFLTLKIGDPDITFSGVKTYHITYTIENALTQRDGHDELFWDITGEGWQIPILSSKAFINSPHAPLQAIDCYTGVVGGDDGNCAQQIDENNKNKATFEYNHTIKYGDNFTVALALDKNNQLQFPTTIDKWSLWLRDNWTLLLLPMPLLIIFIWWWKRGRDWAFYSANIFNLDEKNPKHLKPWSLSAREPLVYEPLRDLTPGEAGALIDEKVDTQDIVAEILELARKKYIKIEQIEKKGWLGAKRDYKISKLKAANKNLPEVQKYLHTELFADGNEVTVSSLKGKFYLKMHVAGQKIEEALVKRKIFTGQPNSARAAGMVVFSLLLGVVFILVAMQVFAWGILWPIPLLIVQIPLGLMFAYNLPQKSAVGHNLWLQARGLKKSIKYGAWREKIKEKNLFIEEVLPFAVSLGVVKELSKHMEQLKIKPPEYFHTNTLHAFTASHFIDNFSSEVGQSLSYNPSSSSSSSGGGFSGGGGGGGGGGSW